RGLAPQVGSQDRRGALEAPVCAAAEQAVDVVDAVFDGVPELLAIARAPTRPRCRHRPLLELARVEEAIAISQGDPEDRAATVPRAHHVDELPSLNGRSPIHLPCTLLEAIVAPELHHVTVQIFTQRDDLASETPAQVEHQLLVRRVRTAELGAALQRECPAAQTS